MHHICDQKLKCALGWYGKVLTCDDLVAYSSMIRYGFPVLCSAGAETL